jgi:hypothetical protein
MPTRKQPRTKHSPGDGKVLGIWLGSRNRTPCVSVGDDSVKRIFHSISLPFDSARQALWCRPRIKRRSCDIKVPSSDKWIVLGESRSANNRQKTKNIGKFQQSHSCLFSIAIEDFSSHSSKARGRAHSDPTRNSDCICFLTFFLTS